MTPKRIAMVGLGGISKTHLHHLKHSPSLDLAGGVDTSPQQREAFLAAEKAPAYSTLEELLSEQDVDGIIVATPPTVREAIVLRALDRKIAVLSEKPLAADACTARKLADHPMAAELLRVGYCHRWTGAAQTARQMIQANEIGELVWINICFSAWMPAMQSHWMTAPTISGGGVLIDNGCHALDLFAYLGGKLQRVQGALRHSWPERGEDSFSLAVQSDQGTLGTLQGSYLHSSPRNEWEIVGTKATLRYSYDHHADTLLLMKGSESQAIPVESPALRFPRQLQEWQRLLYGGESQMATAQEGAVISHWLEEVINSSRRNLALTAAQ